MSPLCCVPHQVVHCRMPDILDTNSAVQVLCSNLQCWQSGLVHPGCFYKWEQKVVRFLVGGESLGSGTDSQVANILWTKQMWDLPLPVRLTSCQCGVGSLKRKFEHEDLFASEVEGKGSLPEPTVELDRRGNVKVKGLGKECFDAIHQSIKEPLGDNIWKTVNRLKSKKKMNNTDTNKTTTTEIFSPQKQQQSLNIKAGPDPYVPPLHHTSQAEGKRDNSGLIHCCSCQTIHTSLPDFLQHCKTAEHCQLQEVCAIDGMEKDENNNNVAEEFDLRREVDQLKSCLLELMKQGLEQDRFTAEKCEELRENINLGLEMNRGTLAILTEKFQELEGKVDDLNKKMLSCQLKVEKNEEDLDSCFDSIQDLKENMSGFSKKLQKKVSVVQEEINVKKSESKEKSKLELEDVKKKDMTEREEVNVKISDFKEKFSRSKLELEEDVKFSKPEGGNCQITNVILLLLAAVLFGFAAYLF
eukprot:GFUD01019177.1.p1 GENE.GFUD01019177.1~~GFUD01019177.1.p1  ORF type:complete len:471 (+),score=149.55 GFUD01019177.1:156-1568(+)